MFVLDYNHFNTANVSDKLGTGAGGGGKGPRKFKIKNFRVSRKAVNMC
jgi:hypothetical protein